MNAFLNLRKKTEKILEFFFLKYEIFDISNFDSLIERVFFRFEIQLIFIT